MPRAPYQVLVIPYRFQAQKLKVAVFKRRDNKAWQFIAGGGESSEDKQAAAKREALEEAAITSTNWIHLDSRASIPRNCFSETEHWCSSIYVIPEHAFAAQVDSEDITLSNEHTDSRWLVAEEAVDILKFDSNRVALWELKARLMQSESGRSGI